MTTILPPKRLSTYSTVKSFTFWKVSLKTYNFTVPPLIRGLSSHGWNDNHPSIRKLLSDYSTVKRLTCWRVGLKTNHLKLYESISVNVAFKFLHIYLSLQDNKSIPMHIFKVHEYLSIIFWLYDGCQTIYNDKVNNMCIERQL